MGDRDPLRHVFLGGTPEEQAQQRALFAERQKLWQAWWSKHWQEFVTQEELQSVELPKRDEDLVEMAGVARYGVLFPTGSQPSGSVRSECCGWPSRSTRTGNRIWISTPDGFSVNTRERRPRIGANRPSSGIANHRWYRQNGIDVRCQGRLDSIDLQLWLVDASRWNTLEAEIQKDTPLELGREATSSLARFEKNDRPSKDDELADVSVHDARGRTRNRPDFPEGSRCRSVSTAIQDVVESTRRSRLRGRRTKGCRSARSGKVTRNFIRRDHDGDGRAAGDHQEFLTDLNTGQKLTFIGPGMIPAHILPETFNELTTRDAREISGAGADVQSGFGWIKIDARLAERPDTFVFKTREGLVGLLQIEPSEEEAGKLTDAVSNRAAGLTARPDRTAGHAIEA